MRWMRRTDRKCTARSVGTPLAAACILALFFGPISATCQSTTEVRGTERLHAVVAFVRFQDDDELRGGCITRSRHEWRDLNALPAVAHHILSPSPEPPFPDSSLTDYFFQQSQGRLTIYGRAYPDLIVTQREERAYGRGASKVLDRAALSREILQRMHDDPDFDLSDFDANGDGHLDYLFVVIRELNELQLVTGGAPAIASVGVSPRAPRGATEGAAQRSKDAAEADVLPSVARGSYAIYRSAGVIIPQLDLIRLIAHEFGHDLWRGTPIAGGHVPFIGGDRGVPANGSRRLGYALMVGRLSTSSQRDVIDTRGDMTISAFERDILDDGWIECPVLTRPGTVVLGDLYTESDCRKLVIQNGQDRRTLYISNRQRVGYFDRLQFNPCQSSYHGLMNTGLLVHVRDDRRLAVPAADNTLELSIDEETYDGDLYGPGSKTQLTPWTRPNISGYTRYPAGFDMALDNWQALDDIRQEDDEEMAFEYVRDVRERPIIRDDSWMGSETSGSTFVNDIVVTNGAALTIESGTTIRLAGRARLIVHDRASLVVERGVRIELGPGSGVDAEGDVRLPEGGEDPFVNIDSNVPPLE